MLRDMPGALLRAAVRLLGASENGFSTYRLLLRLALGSNHALPLLCL